ncbi:MAG: ribonuclease PH [Bifidobacteriaceae bacterium]|jgi:ribonuclease PH|nr:ribonuclease PH [Bifidobacteriaceae bacterium]
MSVFTSESESATGRKDGRNASELRPVSLKRGWIEGADGSVLAEFGKTRVLCVASIEDTVPFWKKRNDDLTGWVTAEYAMLPGSSVPRNRRESVAGKVSGRSHEISRLIGRSLRAVVDVTALGQVTINLDCDVLKADGGTRTASITGAYVALVDAVRTAITRNWTATRDINKIVTGSVSAISVGVVNGTPMLDLPYSEDSIAEVDMNVVQTGDGDFIEVQGTAESAPFSKSALDELLSLATKGNAELCALQAKVLD